MNTFRPVLGIRVGAIVGVVSLAVASAACGDSSEASRPDPTVPEATTSTTVPPFDAAALPPHPLADEADFDAIVRELFAIRDDAFRYLDLDRLHAVYDEACECRNAADEINAAREGEYQIVGDTYEIQKVALESTVENRGAFVLIDVDFPRIDWIDGAGNVVKRGAVDAAPDSKVRVALGHAGRWVIVNIERVK